MRLTAIFVLALLCRLIAVGPALRDPSRVLVPPDSAEYLAIARNVVAGNGFSADTAPPYRPDLRRTPVYPLLLAMLFHFAGEAVRSAAVVGAVLGSLTAAATYILARRLFGTAAATVSGVLLAIDPTSIAYSVVVLTEALFTLLVIAGAVLLVRAESARRTIAASLCWSAAILCRPIALFLPVAAVPIFVWGTATALWRSRYALVNVVCALFVTAWVFRNAAVAGVVTFTSIGTVNLFFHRAAAVQARIERRDVDAVRSEWERRLNARTAPEDEQGKLRQAAGEGLDVIARHPIVYAVAYAQGLARMAGPDHDVLAVVLTGEAGSRAGRWIRRVSLIELVTVYATTAWAIWFTVARSRAGAAALIVPLTFILYFVVTAGPEVYPRFRVPLMPFIVMLSGVGVDRIAATFRR